MGDWTIEIKGHGIHHNKREDDANVLAEAFVADLRAKGHTVDGATFTVGVPEPLGVKGPVAAAEPSDPPPDPRPPQLETPPGGSPAQHHGG